MDPVLVGGITAGLMLFLMFLGVPVAFSMGTAGIIGWFLIGGITPAVGLASAVTFARLSVYEYTVIPLFILMGYIVFYAGFGADLYKTARNWVGHLPGGLAISTVFACAGFAATSGSTSASAATMGRIAVPEMLKFGYDPRLASGCVAAGGTLSAMIPPSILMVVYGVITEQSVGRLLIAGIFPGLLEVSLYSIMILGWARLNPHISPPAPRATWKLRFASLKDTWAVILIATSVIGGIYTGIFTPSEAGGIGTLAAFIVSLSSRRLSRNSVKEAFLDSVKTSVMIFAIIVGAFIFGYQFGVSQLPKIVCEFLVGLDAPLYVIMTGIMMLYLILGCFISPIPMLFLTMPFIFPAVVAFGYDPIWFGVIIVHLGETAQITPPLAVNIYALAAAVPEVDIKHIIRGIGRFVVMDIIMLVVLFAFPQIALFLPNLMKGG